jgi:hypothetical protein
MRTAIAAMVLLALLAGATASESPRAPGRPLAVARATSCSAIACAFTLPAGTAATQEAQEAQYHGGRSWQDYGGGRSWQDYGSGRSWQGRKLLGA